MITPVALDYSRPETQGKDFKFSGRLLAQVMGQFTQRLRLITSIGPYWGNFRVRPDKRDILLFANLKAQWDLGERFGLRINSTLLDKDLQNEAQLLFYF